MRPWTKILRHRGNPGQQQSQSYLLRRELFLHWVWTEKKVHYYLQGRPKLQREEGEEGEEDNESRPASKDIFKAAPRASKDITSPASRGRTRQEFRRCSPTPQDSRCRGACPC
eukprot:scaffold1088_cov247-Pinguiococcus_pyrenoidosus.AAC.13